ncbi:hypothetical protein M9H77_06959 [Catharanthus roseus]|uniref:Uncharacterized protein n=1 Tax=Catharanthus roseus TaxID=4058 RepID=A0ACC0BTK6_CATRO|nr:hypothetical protein M9H77_06959 [Catharanthus roseus]
MSEILCRPLTPLDKAVTGCPSTQHVLSVTGPRLASPLRPLGDDSRMNLFIAKADDMNRTSQSPLDLKFCPITRAQRKKLKLQEDNDMIAYIEDAFKSKIKEFDGQGKPPKLFTMCSIFKEQSRKKHGVKIG